MLRNERQCGFAGRSFALARDVDDAKADAKYQYGAPKLRLPKKAGGTNKRLPIG